MTTAGHALTVHEANSGARIALCSCGWIGGVHPIPRLGSTRKGTARKVPLGRPDVAVENATAEWRAHCQDKALGVAAAAAMAAPALADLAFRRRHT